jgi:V/A-type H+-transporting ATPase subunit E
MKGFEAIQDKILKNALETSDKILSDARAEVETILSEATAKAELASGAALNAAKERADFIYESKITVATRRAKNEVLLAKQTVLDQAYGEAEQKILKMPDGEYKQLIGGLIVKFAESGDSLVPGRLDKKMFSQDFLTGLSAGKRVKLTLNKEVGDFDKGVLLTNGDCDKNFSLDMIMREVRESSEAKVANLCFEVR